MFHQIQKYKNDIEKLSKNDAIIIVKQHKGHGVVILDRTKYIDKCLSMLGTKQFAKLDNHPTSKLESKIQRTLRKIKLKLPEKVYRKLYQQDPVQESSMEMQKYINF